MNEAELKKRTKVFEGELLPANRVEELLDESNQITAIMVASRKSSIENHQSKI